MLKPGDVILGVYEVGEVLRVGCLGVTYACRHREITGQLVSVKVLNPEFCWEKVSVGRFRNEMNAAFGVSHPNVARAYEYLTDGKMFAYTMEYVKGVELTDLIYGSAVVPIADVVTIMSQLCSGLEAIHTAGLVHRDLQPKNVLISKDGIVKIVDMGIARTDHGPTLTEDGGVVGTIDYISPEYMLHAQVDYRHDIYAAGVMAYEMLTGESPFPGESMYKTMMKRLKSDPPPPSNLRPECPAELDRIVLRAMHRDREERYQSAQGIVDDLARAFPECTGRTVGTPV